MKTCYLHLGSNIGDKRYHIETAINKIQISIGNVLKRSDIYETEAWGNTDQDSFYNIAIKIKTKLNPHDILSTIHRIEEQIGRVRKVHWGPRVIDIDILFYGMEVISTKDLKIPHPLILERRFVLQPMLDIAAHYIHPIEKKRIKTLLNNCKDKSEVKNLNE